MDWLPNLVRLVAERALYFAVLALLFFVGALNAHMIGISVPPIIGEWSGVGILLSGGVVLIDLFARATKALGSARKSKAREIQRANDEIDEAQKIVQSLNREEVEILYALLDPTHPQRFDVPYLSNARQMIDKGALIVARHVGLDYVCEVRASIYDNREEIRRAIAASRTNRA